MVRRLKQRKPIRRPLRTLKKSKSKRKPKPALAVTRGRKSPKRPKPTRVEVITPRGKIITVSSRSRLARKKLARIPFRAAPRLGRQKQRTVRKAERSRSLRFGGQLGARTRGSRLDRLIRDEPTQGVFSTRASIRERPILRAGVGLGQRRKRQEARGRVLPPDQLGFFSGDALPRRTFRGRATDFDILS